MTVLKFSAKQSAAALPLSQCDARFEVQLPLHSQIRYNIADTARSLPLAGALASNSLEPKETKETKPVFKFLCKNFADLQLVRFSSDQCALMSICDNVCSAFKAIFSATVLGCIC